MKNKIIAKDKEHLLKLIEQEIGINGVECDLNHIDVSQIKNMRFLFSDSKFNGNISDWDVSNVKDMSFMFRNSQFDGDISKWNTSKCKDMVWMFHTSIFDGDISQWDVSNVIEMGEMFYYAAFNQDISKWDVSNVTNMFKMFSFSQFNQDLTDWKPYKLEVVENMFEDCPAPIPYWAKFEDNESMIKAINTHLLHKELQGNLKYNEQAIKKIKI